MPIELSAQLARICDLFFNTSFSLGSVALLLLFLPSAGKTSWFKPSSAALKLFYPDIAVAVPVSFGPRGPLLLRPDTLLIAEEHSGIVEAGGVLRSSGHGAPPLLTTPGSQKVPRRLWQRRPLPGSVPTDVTEESGIAGSLRALI